MKADLVTQAQTSRGVKGFGVVLCLLELNYGAASLVLEALGGLPMQ